MDKLLAFLREKFSSYPCFQKGGCLYSEIDENAVKRIKIPFFKICFAPFSAWIDNIKPFFLTAALYAAVISLIAYFSGFGYMCIYSSGFETNSICSNSGIIYIIYSLLKFLLVTLFSVKWYMFCYQKAELNFKNFIYTNKIYLKTLGIFAILLLINFLPLISTIILYIRVPNPDWRVEILFFAIVSIGYVIPFLFVRFYSIIAFVLNGEKIPPLKEMWLKNSGNLMNLLAGLFLIFILIFIILGSLYRNFQPVADSAGIYINLVSEFIYNMVFLFGIALFVNHCEIEKQILYSAHSTEKENGK